MSVASAPNEIVVSVMLNNTPEMFECHFGVPMCGAVLNTMNTRLDAETIAFMLNHGEAKVLITDREYSGMVKKALAELGREILVIDVDDPEYTGPRRVEHHRLFDIHPSTVRKVEFQTRRQAIKGDVHGSSKHDNAGHSLPMADVKLNHPRRTLDSEPASHDAFDR